MRREKIRFRIARNVQRLRNQRRLSQRALGDRIGLHQAAISRVERGDQGLGAEEIVLLAEVLRVNPAEILKGR